MTVPTLLLLACTALSLITVALLAILLFRRRRESLDAAAAASRLDLAITTLDQKLHAANLLTAAELAPIVDGLEKLRGGVEGFKRAIEDVLAKPASSTADPVALEHEILAQSWKKFQADRELSATLEEALQDRAWTQFIDRLTNAVPADLKPTFDAVIAPCREHRTLLQQLDLIPRVLNGTLQRRSSDAAEVWLTRELASLLTAESASRLGFRFKRWVTDAFLPFADLYLQRCQESRLEQGDPKLDAGASLVRQVLQIAAVAPIDVRPGETQFDSARHIGRSTSNDPRFADGVITGVIRNGFVEGGQQVIRQPEVIVNRLR